ncbi:uncharacterized protein LOC115003643 [Cottoperca gobio]|uniref:Uncharacterized protein LOC115003643 n=1 Tax=Cottoperca gobio TaxID=56716 RepID=A0A6J2P7L7_COTGO|nr:uncharacterized protein LOC115003643 [Cottoperca gobio]
MLDRFKLSILLQGLTLVLYGPACKASSLGLTVHVVPLDSNEGNTVRAHFSAIAPSPCPALSGLCAQGEDCLVHTTSLPFTGTKPNSGWCVRQWQKTVPSTYNATITLGARVNCPHHFYLSVKDLDGDRVRCRFAQSDQGECLNCDQHSFIELDEKKCMLTFTGKAPAGQYFIYLMAEDLIPVPKINQFIDNKPLSSVPVHLSLTVEESTSSCSEEPVATGMTPKEHSTLDVLPYQEVDFIIDFTSQLESVLEVAVVGPPELYRVGFKSVGSLATMTIAWVRSENKLARLLPICFAANTKSLQSEPRCVWLYQELTCEKSEMSLVLPVASLTNINLAELQLNSPTCPVTYNNTHLIAHISLTGCGTKTVHSGSELVYTNTLQSVRPYAKINRLPSLVLPLACRISGVETKGPQYQVSTPTENEAFGNVAFWIELHLPGEGPMANITRIPKLRNLQMSQSRLRREVESPSDSNNNSTTTSNSNTAKRINQLDLHVMSNCSIDRAEMLVSNCFESATEDFAELHPILEQGCTFSNSTLEVIIPQKYSKIYRLDLSSVETQSSTMYIRCTVNLCISINPSQKCPNLCTHSNNNRMLVDGVYTSTYTISSAAISLMVANSAPTITVVTTPALTTTGAIIRPTQVFIISHAPEQASALIAGVILTLSAYFFKTSSFTEHAAE